MREAFYQIDLFGKGVLLNYKGSTKSKNKVGAVCTILLFAFIIWLTVYFGQQLVDTKNPKATTYDSFNDNPAATPFTMDNFAMGIGMSNPYTYANYINESIYTINVTTYKTTRIPQADGSVDIIYEKIPLEMESCEPAHFGELSDKFAYSGLDGLYCFKKEQPNLDNGQPILEGNWESPVFQGIFVDLIECDRNVTGNNCGTQEEIDYLLGQGLLTLTFTNVAVDLTDSKKPLKKFRDGWYTSTGNAYNKEINLYLEQLEINTDNGWLTSDFQGESYIKFGQITEMFTLAKKSNYVHFVVRLSNVKKHFNRSYTKIQDIIAQVNGTVVVMFTALFIVLAPYVRLKFYEALINDIFAIKMSKDQKRNQITRKATQIKKNSKNGNHKIKQKATMNKEIFSSNEDLEVQRAPSNTPILKNKTGFTESKDTDYTQFKGRPTLDVKEHLDDVMQRPSPPVSKYSKYLKDDGDDESKQKISFSHSRSLSGMPFNYSGFHSGGGQGLDIESPLPILSPTESKREMISSQRKPTFLQPDCKILANEGSGQDLYENVDRDKKRSSKDLAEAFEDSQIRSEDKEKEGLDPEDEKMAKDDKHVLSQMLRSQDDLDQDKNQGEDAGLQKSKAKSVSLQRLDIITSKNSDEINLSFWEYLQSFCTRSEVIKKKIRVLNEGIDRINERLDIFNIFKKLREFDKLKVLLLESEQLVLFHSLPRPELALKDEGESGDSNLHAQNIKDPQFIQEKITKEMILQSYEKLKRKSTSTMLDQKLFEIYDDIIRPKS